MLASFFGETSAFWTFSRLAGGSEIFACDHFPREKRGWLTSCDSPKGLSLPSLFDSGIKPGAGVTFSVCLGWWLGEGLPKHLQKSEISGFLGLCRRCGEHGLSKGMALLSCENLTSYF